MSNLLEKSIKSKTTLRLHRLEMEIIKYKAIIMFFFLLLFFVSETFRTPMCLLGCTRLANKKMTFTEKRSSDIR